MCILKVSLEKLWPLCPHVLRNTLSERIIFESHGDWRLDYKRIIAVLFYKHTYLKNAEYNFPLLRMQKW
jgi:hypothetical protein